jgi:biopolymer transport protein ExbD
VGIRVKGDDNFTIELTPMIDVVFLLIVFFLVATTFHQLEREMAVSVPRSETGDSGDHGPDPVVVNVLDDGRVVVGGNAITLEQLQSFLIRESSREPRTKALIRAHSELFFEKVIEVADACRKANVKISFATLDRGKER